MNKKFQLPHCGAFSMKTFLVTLLLLGVISAPSHGGGNGRLDYNGYISAGSGDEGDWIPGKTSFKFCEFGEYIAKFQMLIVPEQAKDEHLEWLDASAINNVRFTCSDGEVLELNSKTDYGYWEGTYNIGMPIIGFKLRIDPNNGGIFGDDSGLNGFSVAAKPRGVLYTATEEGFEGDWSEWVWVPENNYVCGFNIRSHYDWDGYDDATGLNSIRLAYCDGDIDDDDDGVPDVIDGFPDNPAASEDKDEDGFPESWNPNCDLDCQINSGLVLDKYPTDACSHLVTVNWPGDSGIGSLRQSLADVCFGGTIEINGSILISLSTPLDIDKDVVIDGGQGKVKLISDSIAHLISVPADFNVTLKNLHFENNIIPDSGAAIYNQGTLSVESSVFSNNNATVHGGAIYNQGVLSVDSSVFANNSTQGNGGAIYSVTELTVSNNIFQANHADGQGGAVYGGASTSDFNLINNTFYENDAVGEGDAFEVDPTFVVSSHAEMINNLVINTQLGSDCPTNFPINNSNWVLDGGCNALYSGAPELLIESPNALNNPEKEFGLKESSRAINIGSNEINLSNDFTGASRKIGNRADIGAIEFYTPIEFTTSQSSWEQSLQLQGFEFDDFLFWDSLINLEDSGGFTGEIPENTSLSSLLSWSNLSGTDYGNYGCYPFSVEALEDGATLVSEDSEGNGPWYNTLSIGDRNDYEEDSFKINFNNNQAAPTYFAFSVYENELESGESIAVDTWDGKTQKFSVADNSGFAFYGFNSESPIKSITFTEAKGGDDIALGRFFFPYAVNGSLDIDGDGISNCDELLAGSDMNNNQEDDTDGDGIKNHEDVYPEWVAVSQDDDGDGLPDQWNNGCYASCQTNSGLTLDPYPFDFDNDGIKDANDAWPEHPAVAVDDDHDGWPDSWTEVCDASCQISSGYTLDQHLFDQDNDGAQDTYEFLSSSWAASLSAFWMMDDTPVAVDSGLYEEKTQSTNQVTSIENGNGALAEANGQIDGAIAFDGAKTDYASFINPAELLGTKLGSIEHWVKVESIDRQGMVYFSNHIEGAAGYDGWTGSDVLEIHTGFKEVEGETTSGDASFTYQDGDGAKLTITGGTMVVGQWHHMVATFNVNGSARLYLDGHQVNATGMSNRTYSHHSITEGFIGRVSSSAGNRDLNGVIDELRIWNRALSAAEVNALYQRGLQQGVYDVYPKDATKSYDSDGDGVDDNADVFPDDATEKEDTDGDGVGNNADLFPNDPNDTEDRDGDGVGDNTDLYPDNPLKSRAELIINEVDADSENPDTEEFVELFDGGQGNTPLDGYVLVFFNGNGDVSYKSFDLDGYQSNADGYFVICGDDDYVPECNLEGAPGEISFIQNGADAIALYLADATDFPISTQISTYQLVDAVVYDTNDDSDAELLTLLQLGEPQLNEAENGKSVTESNQRCDYGGRQLRKSWSFTQALATPGNDNNCDSDGDGMPYGYEIKYGLDARLDDSDGDIDGDGLTNIGEYNAKTNLLRKDTDLDGLPDGWELENGRNPLRADYVVTAGGKHTCALGDSGVDCWGSDDSGQSTVPALMNPVSVAAGSSHTCALDDTGVVCWGSNSNSQLVVPPLQNPLSIVSGDGHSCARDDTGVVCWGNDNYNQTAVPILENPVSVAAGNVHTCALDDTGVICWGSNAYGQINVPTLRNPVSVSAGGFHSCALDDTGVVCWGEDVHGESTAPVLLNPIIVAVGGAHSCALDDTGVVCWGMDIYDQSNVPALLNPTTVSAGYLHTCALDDTGAVCWGYNYSGQTTSPDLMIDPDGDGLSNDSDLFPLDISRGLDTDGDGVADDEDAFELDPNETADSDGDGIGDNSDVCPEGSGWLSDETTDKNADGCRDSLEGLTINEFDADQAGTDSAEFIELYNGGSANVSLDGLSIVLYNGSDDASYAAFDLDTYSTDENGYFVICGDASNVSNCDMVISPSTNLIQNGADAIVLLEGDAIDYPEDTPVNTNNVIDAVVYGTSDPEDAGLLVLLNSNESQLDEYAASNGALHSNQRCENGTGGARNTASFIQAEPTPGVSNYCVRGPAMGNCGDSASLISTVQGEVTDIYQDESPMLGEQVIVEAIVTQNMQNGHLANGDASELYNGFWIQEETVDSDDNNATSEGVFIYNTSFSVAEGDQVRLMATVGEYHSATQLSNVSELTICSSANNLPESTKVTLPISDLVEFEALEGMLVSSSQNLVVSDLFATNYGLGNYGQFGVSSSLLFTPTEIAVPGSTEYDVALARRKLDYLLIDDGVSAPFPSFIPYPNDSGLSADNPMRIGYTVPSFSGVMNAFIDNYMVVPKDISIEESHPRTAAPEVDAEAGLIIASMNVLNYFNGNGDGTGFPGSRGAATYEAFQMQRDKIVAALTAMDADVIGLMEIENDGYGSDSAIQDLITALNAAQQVGDEYSFVDPGVTLGGDAIAVGFLYRSNKLSMTGVTTVLDSSNSPTDAEGVLYNGTSNRPTLIQSFDFNGYVFTVAVSHLKSKGSACGENNEGDDGQGNCNVTRTRAAQGLSEFLATNPTGTATEDVLIIGDLNAYSQEDPMQAFYTQGYQNLKYSEASTEVQPYSFSYGGFLGSLDHALASESLAHKTLSVDAWHINSVEDILMNYETDTTGDSTIAKDTYANADAYRSSDHDPIIIGINSLLKDTDNDGLNDGYEQLYGLDPYTNDATEDTDHDGLTHLEEYNAGTHPHLSDTDRDSLPDGWELDNGRNPLQADYMVTTRITHSCAIDDSGVVCWGLNDYGQTSVPVLQNTVSVSAGFSHTCALDDTGVVCWGRNNVDQTEVPALQNPTSVSAGVGHNCAIDDTGVVCWGEDVHGKATVPNLQNPVSVSPGLHHTCALDDTGVVCWGLNDDGQTTVPSLQNPVSVSAGRYHTCALDDTGVVCWGDDEYDQSTVPNLQSPVSVSAGGTHSCVLDASGVICWGDDEYGQIDIPSLQNPFLVAAGGNNTCAFDDTGLVCWGLDADGQSTVPELIIDPDDDGISNINDAFPLNSSASEDTDGDGYPDSCVDSCIDLSVDAFPSDPSETSDNDGDGDGDNADTDDDNDGVLDSNDTYPLIDLGELTDTDNDGAPDSCEAACVESGMSIDRDNDNDGLIEINTLADLDEIRHHLDGQSLYSSSVGCLSGGCNGFELTTDLDFDTNPDGLMDSNDAYWNVNEAGDGEGWIPLGADNDRFITIFEGNGHVIRNLYINRRSSDYVGLFGAIRNAHIRNIVLTGPLMGVMGRMYVGALVGAVDHSHISQIFNTGLVTGSNYVGGLIGHASQENTFDNNANTGAVDGYGRTGGLIGYMDSTSNQVNSSFSTGLVKGSLDLGGLVGTIDQVSTTVNNSYWTIDGSGQQDSAGSLEDSGYVGLTLTILQCALQANTDASNSDCVSADGAAEGLASPLTLYKDWDSAVWDFGTNQQLPALIINGTNYRDSDGDGLLDGSDNYLLDADNDAIDDQYDAFPFISIGQLTDTDGDGAPDECDTDCLALDMSADIDDDNDGVDDVVDSNSLNPFLCTNIDGDAFDDCASGSNNPLTDGDYDADGYADNEDDDADGDGVSNADEEVAGSDPMDAQDTIDQIPPVITLQGSLSITLALGDSYVEPGATSVDNVDGDISADIFISGSVNTAVVGLYNLSYNISDAAGNAADTVVRQITVQDVDAPVVIAPANIEVAASDASGTAATDSSISLFLALATASDNVDGIISSITHNAPATFPLGDTTVTFSAEDNFGNTGMATAIVTVEDQTTPEITLVGQTSITVELGTSYAEEGATASDNVDGDISGSITTTGSVDTNTLGIYTVKYDVTDAAGNTAPTVSRSVSVQDAFAPVVTVSASVVVAATDDNGTDDTNADIATFLTSATANDDVDGVLSVTHDAPSIFPLGDTIVTFSAIDTSGNTGYGLAKVTIEDQGAPVISLMGNTSIVLAVGSTYTEQGATASDNVDGDISADITISGNVNTAAVGLYNLSYNVSDAAANTANSVVRQITVQDVDAPVVTSPGAITVAATDALGTSASNTAIDSFLQTATANDAVSGILLVSNDAPSVFPMGATTVTFSAEDNSGNTGTATAVVTVTDQTAPEIMLVGQPLVTVEIGTSYAEEGATASDNVDGDISADITISGNVNTAAVGLYNLSYNISDEAGNAAGTVVRQITVQDVDAPVVIAPSDIEVAASDASGTVTTDSFISLFLTLATASDNVDGVIVGITHNALAVFPVGGTTVTFSAEDNSGNTGTATAVVTVRDQTPPKITLVGQTSATVEIGTGYTEEGATASDNVDGDVSESIVISGSVDTNSVGIYTVNYDVTDITGNAATTVSRSVSVQDPFVPVITVPASTVVAATNNNGTADTNADIATFLTSAIANDEVDGVLSVTHNAPSIFPLGDTAVTFSAMDTNGNTGYGQAIVTIEDQGAPVISLTGHASITLVVGDTYTEQGATASDNVDGDISADITVSGSVNTATEGLYNLSYNVSDLVGNAANTVVRQVTVQDADAPVVTPPSAITVAAADTLGTPASNTGIDSFIQTATASDTIDGIVSVSNDAPSVFPLGVTKVTFTATDLSNNQGVAQSTVTITDQMEPVITFNGEASTVVAYKGTYSEQGATASDNVDGDLTASIMIVGSVDTAILGVYSIDYNVSDAAGNNTKISRTVTVQDSSAPVVTAPLNITVEATSASGIEASLPSIVDYLNASSALDDVDGIVSVVDNAPATFALGETVVMFTATDSEGNKGVSQSTVSVVDTTAPEITLSGNETVTITIGVTYTEEGAAAEDLVDGDLTAQIITSGVVDTSTEGNYTVQYSVSDANANTVTKTRIVKVVSKPSGSSSSGGGAVGYLMLLLLFMILLVRRQFAIK